ncbi:MAG: hypothetical protein L6V88_00100 [Anaerotruncus sp.]|nr:MAG: hypothetical protein L6V88_00100 [Anaerotruncus sp.]
MNQGKGVIVNTLQRAFNGAYVFGIKIYFFVLFQTIPVFLRSFLFLLYIFLLKISRLCGWALWPCPDFVFAAAL